MAKPLTLSAMIGLSAGTALLAFTVVVALLLNRGLTHVLEEALHDKANALARQLSVISLDAVLLQDYGVLERYTSDLALEPDLLSITIERHDGVVLAQAGNTRRYEDVLTITQPMILVGNVVGQIVVTYDRRRIRDVSRHLFAIAMASMAALNLLLFAVLRVLLRRRLIDPVKALTREMNPLLPSLPDTASMKYEPLEVHMLRKSFEEMRANIRNHLAEMDKANRVAREATQRLCQGQRLATIGQMAAGLAHGLNTPLGNIIGYAQQAQGEAASYEVTRTLAVIERQAMVCSEIVRNMLSSVRAPELMIEDFDLGCLLSGTMQLIQPIAKDNGVEILTEGLVGEVMVSADVASVEQIIFNLTNNAVQAGAKHIWVTIQSQGDQVCLRLCDDGDGIAIADQSSIFDPFFTTKPASSGTGLGLYLCATLADGMRGKIRLEHSQPGNTCFALSLPGGVRS